jgi:hypothetical protein
MPSAKRKAPATPSAAPPAGKKQRLNIDKDPPLSLRRDPATKQITLSGRPAWPEVAKKIKVNRAAPGHIEDRRHLLHWDEHLKPILGSVFTAMEQTYKTNLYNELQSPLRARSLDNRAQNADDTMLFVAKTINGAPGNLVPDRADINQAIEKVRSNLRKYAEALHGDQRFRDDAAIYPPLPGNDGRLISVEINDRVKQYKDLAKQYMATDDSSTLIKSQISDIQSQILEHLNSCVAPHQFWTFLHELEYSVTFDLSAKAKRDATEKSLKWQRKMAANHAQPAKQRYEDLLSLLD